MIKSYDIFGNIAVVKFPEKISKIKKKLFARKILQENKSITTILEKVGKFKGRLRLMETSYVAGEKTKEARYRENGCIFRFNVDTTYFSSRLSNERKEISNLIKKGDKVFVGFAGVSPFSIIIAKNSKASIVYSNEINRQANKYAQLNIGLNNLKEKVILVPGNIRKVVDKIGKKFDVIVMPRPQLKNSFLDSVFKISKKGTRIYYYDFCKISDIETILEKIKLEAKKAKKKIKILQTKSAGEVAPYKIRIRVDFIVQ